MSATPLIVLFIFFVSVLLLVGRRQSARSLASLLVSGLTLRYSIIPAIIQGYNPLLVIALIGLPVLGLVIYITEGWRTRAHLSIVSLYVNYIFTSVLTTTFIIAMRISGLSSEEVAYAAVHVGGNARIIVISALLIGTLGILNEIVTTQVATVEEIHHTDPTLSKKILFNKAYSVGVAHLNSLINTLLFIYAGVSLPLLIILIGNDYGWSGILQNELVSTEIIRTLGETIGLIVAMPTTTWLAVWWYKRSALSTQ